MEKIDRSLSTRFNFGYKIRMHMQYVIEYNTLYNIYIIVVLQIY